MAGIEVTWCVGGDFNFMLSEKKTLGITFN